MGLDPFLILDNEPDGAFQRGTQQCAGFLEVTLFQPVLFPSKVFVKLTQAGQQSL